MEIAGSEIVGLIPRQVLEESAVHHLKLKNYRPDLIVEKRLANVLKAPSKGAGPSSTS